MGRARRSVTVRHMRAYLSRVAAGVLALVLLVGVLRAGGRYTYCPAMDRVLDAPCCAAEAHDAHELGVHLREPDCCEEHVFGKLPMVVDAADSHAELAAPLVGVIPPVPDKLRIVGAVRNARFDRESRAGPIALLRHRSESMVALN